MKKGFLLFFAFVLSALSIHLQAQDSERYMYYLVSDSIYEASSYTMVSRDSVDPYGFIPLTGDDQFIQITNKPVGVICYDAVADSAFYLYAYSPAYKVDETTGERTFLIGEWNPSNSILAKDKGWKDVKNATYPYMYLWWSVENHNEEKYYSFSDLVSGMYYVKLQKENMNMSGDNPSNALILFSKMNDLDPLPPVYSFPIVDVYEYTKHTKTSYAGGSSSGSGYSRYGSLYNYSAFTMLYSLSHSSSRRSSQTVTTEYYTWDKSDKSYPYLQKEGYFKGLYSYYVGKCDTKKRALFHFPDDRTVYSLKKTNDYDERYETYWYDIVPFSSSDSNYFYIEDITRESVELLIDVENKRVCLVPSSFFTLYDFAKDYDGIKFEIDYFFLNYEIEGNETMPLSIADVETYIKVYERVYEDTDGAKDLREIAFGDEKKVYDKTLQIIDWFYLHYNEDGHGWLPPMTEDEIRDRIDQYAKYYNDEEGAKELRIYAFGSAGVDNVSIDGEEDDKPYYNLLGLEVTELEKGHLYIHNGKKFLVK